MEKLQLPWNGLDSAGRHVMPAALVLVVIHLPAVRGRDEEAACPVR
ncbi:hypothetical protein ACFWU3_26455 [Streptomyces sp. NPDC058685]